MFNLLHTSEGNVLCELWTPYLRRMRGTCENWQDAMFHLQDAYHGNHSGLLLKYGRQA